MAQNQVCGLTAREKIETTRNPDQVYDLSIEKSIEMTQNQVYGLVAEKEVEMTQNEVYGLRDKNAMMQGRVTEETWHAQAGKNDGTPQPHPEAPEYDYIMNQSEYTA